MELTNALSKYLNEEVKNSSFLKEVLVDYIKLLAPFAPHFSEEQWEALKMNFSVFNEKWPIFNPSALIKDEVEIAIQVNGKIKAKIDVSTTLDEEGIKAASLENDTIKAALEGKTVRKVIVIKGRLVNIVAN
ncbi:Leucine--tRNA ligase [bioreactor metagenome]|uniref:leucine--tRNA ligase n=1 Tax=bioreactor metagenome TaxID=1076179 RepID=A0A645I5J7_9ZZZZ